MARDCIGAEHVGRERIDLGRAVTQKVGEGNGREGMRVGVVLGVGENHFYDCG